MRKKQCEAALDQLVEEKVVTLKEYGKAKVFLINQDRFPNVDPQLLEAMDDQINIRRDEYHKLNDETKELNKALTEATASQTNSQLSDMIEKLGKENESLS